MAISQADSSPVVVHKYTFPPFQVPVGLIPFHEFKDDSGIEFEARSDGVEIDGKGIPTIALEVRHDTDKCKSNATHVQTRMKKKAAKLANPGQNVKQDWWQVWEEAPFRNASYDP